MSISYFAWRVEELQMQVTQINQQIKTLSKFVSKHQIRAWKARRYRLLAEIKDCKESLKNLPK